MSKLTDADAEQYETQHWIDTALDCGYVNETERNNLYRQLSEIGRMLNGMIEKSRVFCTKGNGAIKEDAQQYLAYKQTTVD